MKLQLKTKVMTLIKEPLDVDFFVDSKPLTKKEISMISDFIKADKAMKMKSKPKKTKLSGSRSTKIARSVG
jgi:hypothetical protein